MAAPAELSEQAKWNEAAAKSKPFSIQTTITESEVPPSSAVPAAAPNTSNNTSAAVEEEEEPPKGPAIDLTGDGGVLKRIIKPADLPCQVLPVLVCYSNVKNILKLTHNQVHYEGKLEGGDPFDSPDDREQKDVTLVVGEGETIEGLDVGILSMKKGEIAEFVISSKYAYGALGCPPRIPPDATLEYEVKLVSFLDSAEAKEEKISKLNLEEMFNRASHAKEEGILKWKAKSYRQALKCFNRGITIFEGLHNKPGVTQDDIDRSGLIRLPLLLNAAACGVKLGKGEARNVVNWCKQALDIDPENAKAYYRMAQGYNMLWLSENAEQKLLRALELLPGDPAILHELQVTRDHLKKEAQESSKLFAGMFLRGKNPPAPAPAPASAAPAPATAQTTKETEPEPSPATAPSPGPTAPSPKETAPEPSPVAKSDHSPSQPAQETTASNSAKISDASVGT